MVNKICRKCSKEKNYTEFIRKERIGRVCNDCVISQDNPNEGLRTYWRDYKRNRYHSDHLFNLQRRIRSLVFDGIKRGGFSKRTTTYKILGCTQEFFIDYIEKQFTEEMNWNNIHLDHIKPISLAKDEEEVLKLNHYTNFQPLLAMDNLKKSNKWIKINS